MRRTDYSESIGKFKPAATGITTATAGLKTVNQSVKLPLSTQEIQLNEQE